MNSCIETSDLSAYVDGELSAARMAAVERHLETCATCARTVAELRLLRAYLQQVPDVELPRPVEWRRAANGNVGPAWDCATLRPQLSALLDGELSDKATESALAHLDTCSDCLREYELLRTMQGLLAAVPSAEPPSDLKERIWARIRADQAALRFAEMPWRWRRWAVGAAAAALAAGIVLVLVLSPFKPANENIGPLPSVAPRLATALQVPEEPTMPSGMPSEAPEVTIPSAEAVQPTSTGRNATVAARTGPIYHARRGASGRRLTREAETTVAMAPVVSVSAHHAPAGTEPVPTVRPEAPVIVARPATPAPADVTPELAGGPDVPVATSLPIETAKPVPPPVETIEPTGHGPVTALEEVPPLKPAEEPSKSDKPHAPRPPKPARNGVLLAKASPDEAKARIARSVAILKEKFGSASGGGESGILQF